MKRVSRFGPVHAAFVAIGADIGRLTFHRFTRNGNGRNANQVVRPVRTAPIMKVVTKLKTRF